MTVLSSTDRASDYYHFIELLIPEEQAVRKRYWEKAEFPFHIIPKLGALGVVGGSIKGYGCPGLSITANAIATAEISRVDASCGTFNLVHTSLDMLTIGMGVDELEQLELQIVEFLGTGEVVRIETTNGWCLPVDSLPSHVHCAITPAQLGISIYQTLGSKLTTTKQYQCCYADPQRYQRCTRYVKFLRLWSSLALETLLELKLLRVIVEFLGTGEVVRIETTNGWCLPVDSLPSHVHCAITPVPKDVCTVKKPHNAEDNNITDDLEVTLAITYYNQNAPTRLDADLIITDLE
ncbi:hypothetical protein DY000_02017090 [Brassica cretica]|uniref:Acyl-CoA dehydrogenase/oxidase N-terminal domain-containing protein n=1 Tax=Brassica cretica TaxID=69181 RepID=A0ABQ7CRR2_BRACR|nr:hypothetical protein DY000_02017090 [Brassica cretica]